MLENCSDVLLEMLKREKSSHAKYYPALESISLTLQFYSAKAYNYVRETFDLGLPHPPMIRRWYSSNGGDPRFSEEVASLQIKASAAQAKGQETLCALMIDEMANMKHIDRKRMLGYVDIGTKIESENIQKAVLVLMAVCIHNHWKAPVAYFYIYIYAFSRRFYPKRLKLHSSYSFTFYQLLLSLGIEPFTLALPAPCSTIWATGKLFKAFQAYFLTHGMTGSERTTLVRQCILKLSVVGMRVESLMCDGPSTFFYAQGPWSRLATLNPSFPDPSNSHRIIHVILDVCRMLKLVRNTLGSCGIIVDRCGNSIKWEYIKFLHSAKRRRATSRQQT